MNERSLSVDPFSGLTVLFQDLDPNPSAQGLIVRTSNYYVYNLFEGLIKMPVAPEESARELLEVVPIVMREIRSQMRSRGSIDLTVPQFRTLAFVNRNKGSSLCEVADHMGLTPPSASILVDGLIVRGMMTRKEHPEDRRRVRLAVTNHGQAILEASTRGTMVYLAEKLNSVSADDRKAIVKAMGTLRSVFTSGTPTGALRK